LEKKFNFFEATDMTLNHENRVRGMNLEEARAELEEWQWLYQAETRDGVPDDKFLGLCLYMSGFVEAHICILRMKMRDE